MLQWNVNRWECQYYQRDRLMPSLLFLSLPFSPLGFSSENQTPVAVLKVESNAPLISCIPLMCHLIMHASWQKNPQRLIHWGLQYVQFHHGTAAEKDSSSLQSLELISSPFMSVSFVFVSLGKTTINNANTDTHTHTYAAAHSQTHTQSLRGVTPQDFKLKRCEPPTSLSSRHAK